MYRIMRSGMGAELSQNYVWLRARLAQWYQYNSATQTGSLPDGSVYHGPEESYLDSLAEKVRVIPAVQQAITPVVPTSTIAPIAAVSDWIAEASNAAAPSQPSEASTAQAPASAIPWWVWLIGGGAVLYFFSGKR